MIQCNLSINNITYFNTCTFVLISKLLHWYYIGIDITILVINIITSLFLLTAVPDVVDGRGFRGALLNGKYGESGLKVSGPDAKLLPYVCNNLMKSRNVY